MMLSSAKFRNVAVATYPFRKQLTASELNDHLTQCSKNLKWHNWNEILKKFNCGMVCISFGDDKSVMQQLRQCDILSNLNSDQLHLLCIRLQSLIEKDKIQVAIPRVLTPGIHALSCYKWEDKYGLHYNDLYRSERDEKSTLFVEEMKSLAEKTWNECLIGTTFNFTKFRLHDETFWESLKYPTCLFTHHSKKLPSPKVQIVKVYGITYTKDIGMSSYCEFITHHPHIANELSVGGIRNLHEHNYGMATGHCSEYHGLSYLDKYDRTPFTPAKFRFGVKPKFLIDRSVLDYVITNQKSIETLYGYDLTDRVLDLPKHFKSTITMSIDELVESEPECKRARHND